MSKNKKVFYELIISALSSDSKQDLLRIQRTPEEPCSETINNLRQFVARDSQMQTRITSKKCHPKEEGNPSRVL